MGLGQTHSWARLPGLAGPPGTESGRSVIHKNARARQGSPRPRVPAAELGRGLSACAPGAPVTSSLHAPRNHVPTAGGPGAASGDHTSPRWPGCADDSQSTRTGPALLPTARVPAARSQAVRTRRPPADTFLPQRPRRHRPLLRSRDWYLRGAREAAAAPTATRAGLSLGRHVPRAAQRPRGPPAPSATATAERNDPDAAAGGGGISCARPRLTPGQWQRERAAAPPIRGGRARWAGWKSRGGNWKWAAGRRGSPARTPLPGPPRARRQARASAQRPQRRWPTPVQQPRPRKPALCRLEGFKLRSKISIS